MYTERLVECGDCEDRFKIVYDSKKDRQDEYSCKCGKLVCYPDYFGGYNYNRYGNPNRLSYEESEVKYEYYEEDYIRLTEEEQELLNEIDAIGNIIEEDNSLTYHNFSDEDDVHLELYGCSKSNEGMTVCFKNRLRSYGNGWSESHILETHERLKEGLSRFKSIIIKVRDGEIDLDQTRELWEDKSFEWNGRNSVQQELYDYKLYC